MVAWLNGLGQSTPHFRTFELALQPYCNFTGDLEPYWATDRRKFGKCQRRFCQAAPPKVFTLSKTVCSPLMGTGPLAT
jgi:hypothetical protein